MKVVVLGAGAVGGYFGGRLAQAGLDVTFLVREHRAKQLRSSGLMVKSVYGDFIVDSPRLALSPEDIGPCDLVIIGLKNYHLHGATAQIKALAKQGAKVLPIINGIEHFQWLQEEVGAENVLGGMCQIISTLDTDGVVHHTNKIHNLTFGPLLPSQLEFCKQAKAEMQGAQMNLRLSEHILVDIWTKYSFITAYSGTTTGSRLSIDEILACEATKDVYIQALREMCNLAEQKNVQLPKDLVDKNLQVISGYLPGTTSSMHQDFRKGLPLEVDSLQGAAVRLAKSCNIEVPTIKTLYGLIKPYESGNRT